MDDKLNNIFAEGASYYYGKDGYPLDYGKAFELFSEAANGEEVNSMVYLAIMYINANGVARNYQAALEWLNTALSIDKCNSDVYRNIGYMYNNGFGVNKNIGVALDCYMKAVKYNTDKNSRLYFEDCFIAGCLLVNCNNLRGALPYFKEAAERGNKPEAWHNIGYIYSKRAVPGATKEMAVQAYSYAASMGYAQSMYDIGCIYVSNGMYAQGKPWFENALARGYEPARKQLKRLNLILYSQSI